MQVPQDELDHRVLSAIRYFIIHHSVTAQDLDISQIAQMEKVAQNFVTVGYHCIVRKLPNGEWQIQEGRTIDDVPAAAYGLNTPSYDLCVLGNYEPNVEGVPTTPVDEKALVLVKQRILAVKAKCPNLTFLNGHRDVAPLLQKELGLTYGQASARYGTACPGDLLQARLHQLRLDTNLKSAI